MNDDLPYSEACERNKAPILDVLRSAFAARARVLELGAGTGQHAVYLARNLPHLQWQPTDQSQYLPGLAARIRRDGGANLAAPVLLDVAQPWPVFEVDAVYTANTLHIMSWPQVLDTFRGVGRVLPPRGVLAVYGPFRYGGSHTSPSNRDFDAMLRERDPASGIRDLDDVIPVAAAAGLELLDDHALPANNRLLSWEKVR
jgi:SAM-dependent methyltransferase